MTNPTDLPGPSVSVMTLAKAPLPDAEKARAGPWCRSGSPR